MPNDLSLNSLHAGYFFIFFLSSADNFNISFLKIYSFENNIRVSNSFDPDQARHSVGPDLGPNCLQRSSTDNKICY